MKQTIVNYEPNLIRMALLEEGKVVEYAAERAGERGLLGSFFKGRVVNVLPGMQAAFVDIGQKKNAFLYIDDVLHPHLDKQPKIKPAITELLHVGQDIIVQVFKEPVGGKGARVTTHYALPGRWIVYMPMAGYIAVSKKIAKEGERSRLKSIAERCKLDEEGMIIRTVSEHESLEAIEGDLIQLRKVWQRIEQKASMNNAPRLLHQDLSILQRFIRDSHTAHSDEFVIDNEQQAKEAKLFYQEVALNGVPNFHVYHGDKPVFEAYGVQEQLIRDFKRKVWLEGGGYVVIDHTEALTVIDVNTGKYIGGRNLEETVTKTNIQAAIEIARLLRLRDIGGIIIIDFIDMEFERHRDEVMLTLERELQKDRTKSHVVGWTRLGLLELTRKKVREESSLALE
ncbi:Rne/Rng family ribonuclease [Paenibacillus provencensis]|uniref:Rne/Rng family ribonuclease n=1 Tax=Paenibacillus provencensis TaxID=441151 RepID=A0ABW3PX95_9BACL|nr:Rne/Rng family ribonuclease [Paenibacillus sp. MER 78]MCM3129943.1 Rne/Rng family ribonuclease [Paenibacillus sp. MER 78]